MENLLNIIPKEYDIFEAQFFIKDAFFEARLYDVVEVKPLIYKNSYEAISFNILDVFYLMFRYCFVADLVLINSYFQFPPAGHECKTLVVNFEASADSEDRNNLDNFTEYGELLLTQSNATFNIHSLGKPSKQMVSATYPEAYDKKYFLWDGIMLAIMNGLTRIQKVTRFSDHLRVVLVSDNRTAIAPV